MCGCEGREHRTGYCATCAPPMARGGVLKGELRTLGDEGTEYLIPSKPLHMTVHPNGSGTYRSRPPMPLLWGDDGDDG